MSRQSLDQFLGGQFAWFTAVVEDVMDPLEMGRVRVRCFGYHTDDKNQISTEALPWALVMTPIQSSSMSRVGISATGIQQGSWVVGFFRDGPSAQDPFVLGTVPSTSSPSIDPSKGFNDPAGINPTQKGVKDIPVEATSQYSQSSAYDAKSRYRFEQIETAVPSRVSTVAVDEPDSYYERKTWSNWSVPSVVKPAYPQNQVFRTASGHVREFDDTPGYERISETHKSGTYYEIDANGNKTTVVVKNNYTVVIGDEDIYVRGNANLTVEGDVRTLVKGNYHLEVLGNKTEFIHGSRQSKVGQSDQTEIDREEAINVASNRRERIGEELNTIVEGNRKEVVGLNSDVLVKGDDGHLVLGTRKEYTKGQIDMSGSSIYNINSAGVMNIETFSNMNILTVGDKMEIVVGNRGAMILQDDSVTSITGNMSQLVVAGSYTTTVTAGALTTNVVAGARTSIVGGLDSITSGSTTLTTGTTSITAGATTVTTGALTVNGGAISVTGSGALSLTGTTSSLTGGVITVGGVSGTNWGYGIGNVRVT